jgi:hypothetical protein
VSCAFTGRELDHQSGRLGVDEAIRRRFGVQAGPRGRNCGGGAWLFRATCQRVPRTPSGGRSWRRAATLLLIVLVVTVCVVFVATGAGKPAGIARSNVVGAWTDGQVNGARAVFRAGGEAELVNVQTGVLLR